MSEPSTPSSDASTLSSSAPCGAAFVSRKSLQPYNVAVVNVASAVTSNIGWPDTLFIISLP